MKRWFIAALAVLIFAALLVAAIERDPGYVLVAYRGYSLETSLWVGLALLLLVVLALYALVRLISGGLSLGGGGWLRQRREQRQRRRTTAGLIAYIEGNWARARKLFERAANDTEQPLLQYLAAARASNALGDAKATRAYLSKAEHSMAGASVAVELTQAELQLENGQLEECLATLQRASRNADRHPYVLHLLQRVYRGLRDWPHLLELMPELRRHRILPPERLDALEREAYRGQLEALGARHGGDSKDRALHQFWRSLPKALSRDPLLVGIYARQLLDRGAAAEAAALVQGQLKRSWDRDLVRLYGLIEGPDPQRQLLVAEQWLTERNSDAMLLLTLGRLALRNQLWGKARDYFETSLKLEESAETCAELGRLLAHLDEPALSSGYFQRGLLATAPGLPALPMPGRHRVA